jgi:hypothetical protein
MYRFRGISVHSSTADGTPTPPAHIHPPHPICCRRAPEPSDIIWSHTSCTGVTALGRRLWSWTLTALLIAAGAGVQYGLAVLAEVLRKGRMESEFGSASRAVLGAVDVALGRLGGGGVAGDAGALGVDPGRAARLRAISVAAGVAVVAVNLSVIVAVRQVGHSSLLFCSCFQQYVSFPPFFCWYCSRAIQLLPSQTTRLKEFSGRSLCHTSPLPPKKKLLITCSSPATSAGPPVPPPSAGSS